MEPPAGKKLKMGESSPLANFNKIVGEFDDGEESSAL